MNKKIGDLTVYWKENDSHKGDRFEVILVYKGITFVKQKALNKVNPVLSFSLRCSDVEIRGRLRWQEGRDRPLEGKNEPFLKLDLDYPENQIIGLYPNENPIPNPSASFEYLDLFPYVYIFSGSRIPADQGGSNLGTSRDTYKTKKSVKRMYLWKLGLRTCMFTLS